MRSNKSRQNRQTSFLGGAGNALQACVSSIFNLSLESVPNFILDKNGYLHSLNNWLSSNGMCFVKVPLQKVAANTHSLKT